MADMNFLEIRNLFHIEGNIGFHTDEINRAENKWGALPAVLKEYYRQLGAHERLNRTQNFLRRPDELFEWGEYLVFYIENQDCVDWCIHKEDLAEDNPAVYCRNYNDEMVLESSTLTDFLNAMALFQAGSWGMTHCDDEIYSITEEQAEKIRKKYMKRKYELHQWLRMSFYGNFDDEVILMTENGDYDLTFGAENGERFREMEEFMRGLGLEAY